VAQGLLQAPQFLASLVKSTQAPLHAASGAMQLHAPIWHSSKSAQAWVHEPQCSWWVERSKQPPEHSVWPAPQPEAQVPLRQTWPVEQALPQAPQFFGSPEVSEQTSPQRVKPVLHWPVMG
jgi:hypothetical protein